MPRRKKFLTKKRYRTKVRKAYRKKYRKRKIVKGKRGRFKKYHKRKAVGKTYGLRKYAGIKWTRYLTLPEFLTDDKWDVQWAYNLYQLPTVQNNQGQNVPGVIYLDQAGNNIILQQNLLDWSKEVTLRTFTVLSTDLWSNKTLVLPPNTQFNAQFKAYNPYPSTHNFGPLWTIYSNQYKKFKYVGMKVKWIPGCTKTPTLAPTYESTYTTHNEVIPNRFMNAANANALTTYEMENDVEILTADTKIRDQTFLQSVGVNTNRIYEDPQLHGITVYSSQYPNLITPLSLRLWINFDKKGYESLDARINCTVGSNVMQNNAANFTNSRFKFRRLFDPSGMKRQINDSLTKSYSLLKPFKFFVRPMVSRQLLEDLENENLAQNMEDNTRLDQMFSDLGKQTSGMYQTSLKMPYISVNTHTQTTLGQTGLNVNSANLAATQIVGSLKDDLFMDPILFGWALSCDNLPIKQQLDLFQHNKINNFTIDNNFYYSNWQVSLPNNYLGYGKFKVTYYMRFKEFNPLQLPQSLNVENASGNVDVSSLVPEPTN